MSRVETVRFTGLYDSRSAAVASVVAAGDMALVKKDVLRMLLMNCPCGCGDILTINLDSRAGAAWKFYQRGKVLSLYPSYWRDSKCCSHFILWKNHINWCDWDDEDLIWTSPNAIEECVWKALPSQFINYLELAEQLEEIPWDVLQACYALVRKGKAIMNTPRRTGEFRRAGLS